MALTMFSATCWAKKEVTRTFDMAWALDVGIWNLRTEAKKYFEKNPEASDPEAKEALVNGLTVRGLSPRRIALELTWEYEEEYIAELLLINATAIFDTWVDSFVEAALPSASSNQKRTIKADFKKGSFSTFDNALSQETISPLAGCFKFNEKRQDLFIENLRKIYKYFKSCRNCCAHGTRQFNDVCENNYNDIKSLTKEDCGLGEFPKMIETFAGQPFKLILRGVVGFYDVLLKIMLHYDIAAADKKGIEAELLSRWRNIRTIKLSSKPSKRNLSIRNYIVSINMCRPISAKTDDVYNFLLSNNAI